MANEYDEFRRHNVGGWGRIPLQKSGGMRAFRIIEAGPEEGAGGKNSKIQIEIITARKTTKVLFYNYSYIVENAEWYFPESKYVNTKNYVLRSVAYPKRQYAKILTPENCYFSEAVLGTSYPPELREILHQSILDALDNYLAPYPSYQECLLDLRMGNAFARAFTKRLLITMNPEILYPLLVYKGQIIGFDREHEIICIPDAEKLNDILVSATGKGIVYSSSGGKNT